MSKYEVLSMDNDTVVVRDNIINITVKLTKEEFERWKASRNRLERDEFGHI